MMKPKLVSPCPASPIDKGGKGSSLRASNQRDVNVSNLRPPFCYKLKAADCPEDVQRTHPAIGGIVGSMPKSSRSPRPRDSAQAVNVYA